MPLRNDLADDPAIKADPDARAVRADRHTTRAATRCRIPLWADIAANDIVDAVQKALLAPEKTDEIFRDLDARADQEAEGHLSAVTRDDRAPRMRGPRGARHARIAWRAPPARYGYLFIAPVFAVPRARWWCFRWRTRSGPACSACAG